MARKPAWQSRIPDLVKGWDLAERAGLRAAGNEMAKIIRPRLRGGYKGGQFQIGGSRVGELHGEHRGSPVASSVRVQIKRGRGTLAAKVVGNLTALFWEIGHHNIFTRQYERVEIWRPALIENRDRVAQWFAAAMKKRLALYARRRVEATEIPDVPV